MENKSNPGGNTGGAPVSGKNQNTAMAVIAYLGPLVIVSYLIGKDDAFVKFHVKQGLVLFVVEVVMAFLVPSFWFFLFFVAWLVPLIQLALLI
ncbi:MAG: hypothetical protein AAB923_02855, partial [Patescibacteria group bacterium]